MQARELIDRVKKELGIEHDKDLAEIAKIKIGTLTKAIGRNSFQYEIWIPFLIERGVDLNELFGGKANTFNISSPDMDEHIIKLVYDKFMYYADNGGRLLTLPFSDSIKEVIEDYDQKVEKIRAALKS